MTDLTARKKMLGTLSDDLVYEGWDLPCKFWMVLGSYDDPYLEFVGNFTMDPDHWFMHRAEEGTVKDHVLGLTTCWESWCYPLALSEHLSEHQETGNDAIAAYGALIGPDEHPERANLRTLMSVFRDGVVLRVQHHESGKKNIKSLEAPTNGPVGITIVDYMRSVLGINEHGSNPLHRIAILLSEQNEEFQTTFQAVVETAQRENWPQERLSAEIYKRAPKDLQQKMAHTMPDDVRRYLDDESNQ